MNPSPVSVHSLLVVEDDAQIRDFLQLSLRAAGYVPLLARTLAEALQLWQDKQPAMLILDLGLPDGDGLSLIQTLRARSDRPILVLSARQSEQDKVQCLNQGADDYLAKPFGVDELLARIRVALRRMERMQLRDQRYLVEALQIDLADGLVRLHGETLHLSPLEYKLLMQLAQHAGRVMTHRQLLQAVWGAEYVDDTHYLRIHMGRLRAKIERDPAAPRYLITELGIGYRLAAS
ncbi:response regulator [Pseudomethylobacillus aquaticus]|uniref:Response regulator n=2 Tax=Pseudomethylobacillus aquaticus TaxID=2676064 RepID=A0A3N0UW26_9PROT|nr:response regulator [Pseudomethylobacillus aquaticus]ROH84454.1 response regulator [Pseudomethylobacillus aquaticus]